MKKWFKRFWVAFWRPEMLILPGEIAFFLFLSLVPTITLISYATSYLGISENIIQTVISNGFGVNLSELLTPMMTQTSITPSFLITMFFGYFIASNGMSSIIVASNTIYGIKDSGFFKRRFKAIVMELFIVILFLFILVVPLLGDQVINMVSNFGWNDETVSTVTQVFKVLMSPVYWVIIYVFIKWIYTLAPDKTVASKSVRGGALFTTIGWVGATTIYAYYINHIANYSMFYGSIAGIVILMLWVYVLSYIFVIGMAMNYHESLEKTGVIDVQKLIEQSANTESKVVAKEKKSKEK
jgi:membrane protein